ncbi:hypothetical protein GHT06_011018 [Daphnia sinensis]|uniref:Uncharacterized protein n=1 Tax=Daphnia sinensis TaxID=1820382 RepID=A0AAD5KZ92_9CRUS|nr:hypothetical protein GHT06_011018 [Daphnia sinensis]
MKHSFVALFSVLTCIVYGQLPANWNHHPYGFRPYVAKSPSALRNVVNSPIAVEPSEQPETRNQVLLMTQISMLELTIDELAKEFRKKLSDSEAKVEALTNRLNAFTCTCSADTPKTINEIPSSCADLKGVGNTRSGLYSVMGRKQVEIVYCDFTKPTGDFVGRTQLAEVNGIRNPNHLSPITVQATLKLQEGDEVWLQCDYISGGFLYDTAADRGRQLNDRGYKTTNNSPPLPIVHRFSSAGVRQHDEVLRTSQALHLTPSVVTVDTDLKGMTDTLTQTKQELAKTQLTLETVKTDLKSKKFFSFNQ